MLWAMWTPPRPDVPEFGMGPVHRVSAAEADGEAPPLYRPGGMEHPGQSENAAYSTPDARPRW
ncbi:hypothetical protein [Streptomyces sp. NPDC097640]|uniref:hypothetical protein n=1 Tax=Streptomyces sp. NPDC097640 TaxID=3157229 RepID=UPI00331C7B8D